MYTVYLGLGANILDPIRNLAKAVALLKLEETIHVIDCSSLYRTEPVSTISQPDYFNAVVKIKTLLEPDALFEATNRIEKCIGKREKEKDAPRPIDIDILFYEGEQPSASLVYLPHPLWKERLFVLYPLKELYFQEPLLVEFAYEVQALIDRLEMEKPYRCEKYPSPLMKLDKTAL